MTTISIVVAVRNGARTLQRCIGRDRLELMGYDLDELLNELDAVSETLRGIGSDVARLAYTVAYCGLELRILKQKGIGAPGLASSPYQHVMQ